MDIKNKLKKKPPRKVIELVFPAPESNNNQTKSSPTDEISSAQLPPELVNRLITGGN